MNAQEHEVNYVEFPDIDNQVYPTVFDLGYGMSGFYMRFVSGPGGSLDMCTRRTPTNDSVWLVKVREESETRQTDAILKVFHTRGLSPRPTHDSSEHSARYLMSKIWDLWLHCKTADTRAAILPPTDTAMIELDGPMLYFAYDDPCDLESHFLYDIMVSGVLIKQHPGSRVAEIAFTEADVLHLLTTMGRVLDVMDSIKLVHCGINEYNIAVYPNRYDKYMLIDYCDLKCTTEEYSPHSTWTIPIFADPLLDSLRLQNTEMAVAPTIHRLMLFYMCMRLLAGRHLMSGSQVWETLCGIADRDRLVPLLMKPFPPIPNLDGDMPNYEMFLRRLRQGLVD